MPGTTLTLAAVAALAVAPECGGARPNSEFADRLLAVAQAESGFDPWVLGVNGPGAGPVRSASAAEAAAKARALIAAGRSVDLGLMQINAANLSRHGLTPETAFDACRNMAAGADHLAADWQAAAIWRASHSRYNAGDFVRGAAYAAGVERVLARVRDGRAAVLPDTVARAPAPPPAPPAPGPRGVLIRRAGQPAPAGAPRLYADFDTRKD